MYGVCFVIVCSSSYMFGLIVHISCKTRLVQFVHDITSNLDRDINVGKSRLI